MTYDELNKKANEIRRLTLQTIARVGKGHIGGSVSLCELMSVLYFKHLNIDVENPKWEDRDRLIMSKGHAGPVVYAAMALKGIIPLDELATMNKLGTNLPSHCDETRTPGIDVTTGSLAQGFSIATGIACGAKLDSRNFYIYPIIGDGESQEGQIWEAAMFASSKRLDNIIAFTDYNKMQIDGLISEVNDLEPLDEKWKSFGWHVQVIDGHDIKEIDSAIINAKNIKNKPHMILLNTIKGKGISFAENVITNHSMAITQEMYQDAMQGLDESEKSL